LATFSKIQTSFIFFLSTKYYQGFTFCFQRLLSNKIRKCDLYFTSLFFSH
jgi:hypothetical protein